MLPVALGLTVSVTVLLCTLAGNTFSVFVLLPAALVIWTGYVRPIHRRRYRRALADLPRWSLTPDTDEPGETTQATNE